MLTGCTLAGRLPVASSVRWGTVFAWPSLHRHGGYEIQGHVRQEPLVVKVTGFRSEGPGLKCCPNHLLAVWLWASNLTTVSLYFPIHKMGRTVVHMYRVVVRIKLNEAGKVFSTMMASGEGTQDGCVVLSAYATLPPWIWSPHLSDARQEGKGLGLQWFSGLCWWRKMSFYP